MVFRENADDYIETMAAPIPVVGLRTPANVDITALRTIVVKAAPSTTVEHKIGRVWGILSLTVWSPTLPIYTVISGFYTLYLFSSLDPSVNFTPDPDPDKAFLVFSDYLGSITPLLTPPGTTSFLHVVIVNNHASLPVYVTLGLR